MYCSTEVHNVGRAVAQATKLRNLQAFADILFFKWDLNLQSNDTETNFLCSE
jgi:hypothetical protein